jgi:plasmid stability protein
MLSLMTLTTSTARMATLTVRNLDEELVRQLRIRAAEHGRSAEAEHREILKAALSEGDERARRQLIARKLAEFRRQTEGRGSDSSAGLLAETRAAMGRRSRR